MKSRASLVLMEQLIMVLVFALAAALCLRGFVKTEEISVRTARRDEAVCIAQNAAELLKAGKEPEVPLKSGFALVIQKTDTDIPEFQQAEIRVAYEGENLFSLTVGWQEVDR